MRRVRRFSSLGKKEVKHERKTFFFLSGTGQPGSIKSFRKRRDQSRPEKTRGKEEVLFLCFVTRESRGCLLETLRRRRFSPHLCGAYTRGYLLSDSSRMAASLKQSARHVDEWVAVLSLLGGVESHSKQNLRSVSPRGDSVFLLHALR